MLHNEARALAIADYERTHDIEGVAAAFGIFMQVQEELVRRANMVGGIEGKRKRVYSRKYALSSLCTCTHCGDIYRRIAWNNRGKRSNVWRCCTRSEKGPKACDAPTVREEELQQATVTAINRILRTSPELQTTLLHNIENALADDNSGELETLKELLAEKQKELVRLSHAKKDYTPLADEIESLREKKQRILVKRAEAEGVKKRIAEIRSFLENTEQELTEYDEAMVRRYIQNIKIFDDRFAITFKAGITLDIER